MKIIIWSLLAIALLFGGYLLVQYIQQQQADKDDAAEVEDESLLNEPASKKECRKNCRQECKGVKPHSACKRKCKDDCFANL